MFQASKGSIEQFMDTSYRQPQAGCYQLTRGVRIMRQGNGWDSTCAICDYPLRVIRLKPTTARLLSLCTEERTCEQLARQTNMPVQRVATVCEQWVERGILEAGPALPPAILPSVSIVIPSHNRVRELARCVHSLLELQYPAHHLEIIIVDDASTDDTAAMLQGLVDEAAEQDIALHIIRHAQQQGVAHSRNTGAQAARHELIAYIDSDCVASPGWLAELVPTFQDECVAAVGGMIRAYERRSLLGQYEDVRSSLFMGVRPQQVRLEGPLTYLPTANLLIRRTAWQQLGGFAPLTFGEDVDFCHRLLLTGAHIRYIPQGVVYHDYRTSVGAFLRTRVNYASSEAVLLQRHATKRRVLVLPPEQATFTSLGIGALWSIMWAAITARFDEKKPICKCISYSQYSWLPAIVLAGVVLAAGVRTRYRRVRAHRVPLGVFTVCKATLRAHLAYCYHLCRHLTRYYTLLLLLVSWLIPPLFVLTFLMYSIVVGVDYVRLRPAIGLGEYLVCSLLDDCAYEVGVVIGCIKCRTWKPLVPLLRRRAERRAEK